MYFSDYYYSWVGSDRKEHEKVVHKRQNKKRHNNNNNIAINLATMETCGIIKDKITGL
jgi:hypothetical protein